MSRQSRRLSRILLTVLLISFSAAALTFIYRMNRQSPSAAAAAPTGSGPSAVSNDSAASAAGGGGNTPTPLVSNQPSAPSTTQPARQSSPVLSPPSAEPAPPHAEEAAYLPAATPAPSAPAPSAPAPSAASASLIPDAQAKIDAGRLLEARADLNAALQSGTLSDSQAAAVKNLISQINQTVVFGQERFVDDNYGGVYVVKPGDSLARIANAHDCTWEMLSRINGIDPRRLRAGATIKLVEGPFFAVVTKHNFTMDIYLGGLPGEKSSMFITSYLVGLGRDDSTPVGTWMIEPHRKLKHPTYYSPRGEGVIDADDPKNPLGGYWIGLTGTDGQAVGKMSYGIHGTIDQSSIGKQSSMGCIRLGAKDIPVVFDMLVEGRSMVVVKN